jgi:hypothetical protein
MNSTISRSARSMTLVLSRVQHRYRRPRLRIKILCLASERVSRSLDSLVQFSVVQRLPYNDSILENKKGTLFLRLKDVWGSIDKFLLNLNLAPDRG